jgi:hypothetical protein
MIGLGKSINDLTEADLQLLVTAPVAQHSQKNSRVVACLGFGAAVNLEHGSIELFRHPPRLIPSVNWNPECRGMVNKIRDTTSTFSQASPTTKCLCHRG